MKKYEGLFILDTAGKEEGIKDVKKSQPAKVAKVIAAPDRVYRPAFITAYGCGEPMSHDHASRNVLSEARISVPCSSARTDEPSRLDNW